MTHSFQSHAKRRMSGLSKPIPKATVATTTLSFPEKELQVEALHFGTKDRIRKHTYTLMEGMWVYTYITHLNNILYIYIYVYITYLSI